MNVNYSKTLTLTFEPFQKEVLKLFNRYKFISTNFLRDHFISKGYTHYHSDHGKTTSIDRCSIGASLAQIPGVTKYSTGNSPVYVLCI